MEGYLLKKILPQPANLIIFNDIVVLKSYINTIRIDNKLKINNLYIVKKS